MRDRFERTLQRHCRKFDTAVCDYVRMKIRKRIQFTQRGAFPELVGEDVGLVAAAQEIVATKRDGARICALPVQAFGGAKKRRYARTPSYNLGKKKTNWTGAGIFPPHRE